MVTFTDDHLSHQRGCVALRANRSGELKKQQVARFNTRKGIFVSDRNDRTSLNDIVVSPSRHSATTCRGYFSV